jgi:phospholipid/cholesterol/gamma-HCH transport system substrate-binding protein
VSNELPALPQSRTRDQALWVGLFLLVAIAVSVILLYTLTDAAMFRGRYIVTTQVADAGGIRRGDPVQMRGVNVGRVMGFAISARGVTIRLELEGQFKVPKDSKVELRSAGMLGGMIANIVPGASTEMLGYGDTVAGAAEEAMASAMQRLTDRAGQAMDRVDALLSDAFVKDVHGGGTDLRALLKTLSDTTKEQREQLRALEASFQKNSESIERVAGAPELERAVKRLDGITERADKLIESLNRSSQNAELLLSRLDRGEGTLGKLSKDEQLYKEMNDSVQALRKSATDLGELVTDIKKNPKKYLKFSVF